MEVSDDRGLLQIFELIFMSGRAAVRTSASKAICFRAHCGLNPPLGLAENHHLLALHILIFAKSSNFNGI
jgi:hypothetical protein